MLSFFKLRNNWHILVSDIQHNDLIYTYIYIAKWSLQKVYLTFVTVHKYFFSFMRIFKIYSLGTFQICNIALLLTIVTMLYIPSPGLTHFIMGSLYLLIPFTHSSHPLPPASGSHQFVLCIYELLCLFRFHI